MILTAHQPLYVPWLGFFHKIMLAETICILDDVQFSDGDYINRNRVRTKNGSQWLTVPVQKKGHLLRSIRETRIVGHDWRERHIGIIKQGYSGAPFFENYFSEISDLLKSQEWEFIFDLDMAFLEFAFRHLQMSPRILLSSEMNIQERKSDLILEICKESKADVYISGEYGDKYLDISKFRENQIEVAIQKYQYLPYPQIGEGFVPDLSILDLLFNVGPSARQHILNGICDLQNVIVGFRGKP